MRRALLLLVAAAAAGFSPLEVEEPHVREGNEQLAAGHPEEALPRYDAAERLSGPRPEIAYDRGVALYRLGKSTEARDAFRRALALGAGKLSSRAQQNLGNALLATGDREGAIAAFTEALRSDPGNEDARYDLEVLLRRAQQEEARRRATQGGQPQGQSKGEQAQAGAGEDEPRGGERGPAERRAAPGKPGDERAPRPRTEPGRDPGGEPAAADDDARLSQEDAARILDAFRAREKAFTVPGGTERPRAGRRDADRDW
jgi:Ca-activated chloride channel family protein